MTTVCASDSGRLGSNTRPTIGATPSSPRTFGVTAAAGMRAGSPEPTRLTDAPLNAPSDSNDLALVRTSRYTAGDISFVHPQPTPVRGPSHSRTSASGLGNGSGRASTKSATENVAALAPTRPWLRTLSSYVRASSAAYSARNELG